MKLPLIGLENDLLPPPLTIRKSTAQGQSPWRHTIKIKQNRAATLGLAGLCVLSDTPNVSARIFPIHSSPSTVPHPQFPIHSSPSTVPHPQFPIHRPPPLSEVQPPCCVLHLLKTQPEKPIIERAAVPELPTGYACGKNQGSDHVGVAIFDNEHRLN